MVKRLAPQCCFSAHRVRLRDQLHRAKLEPKGSPPDVHQYKCVHPVWLEDKHIVPSPLSFPLPRLPLSPRRNNTGIVSAFALRCKNSTISHSQHISSDGELREECFSANSENVSTLFNMCRGPSPTPIRFFYLSTKFLNLNPESFSLLLRKQPSTRTADRKCFDSFVFSGFEAVRFQTQRFV